MYIEIPESELDFTFDIQWLPEEGVERAMIFLWEVPIYTKDYPADSLGVGHMENDIKAIVANKLAKLLED